MTLRTNDIFREISRLIFLVESSGIDRMSKFKIVKVLLVVKLNLFELLKKEAEAEAGANRMVKAAENGGIARDSKKHELILQFIKNNGGRVGSADLLGLGIAGRSLRRYLRNLCDGNKIKIERSGRNFFYLVV